MFQVNLTGMVESSAEIYDTDDHRRLHRFDTLVTNDLIQEGRSSSILVRVVLAERMAHYADHITRGRRILVQGTLVTFRQVDAEGVDREKIMVVAHFVELLGPPVTRKMAETAAQHTGTVHHLPELEIEEEVPF